MPIALEFNDCDWSFAVKKTLPPIVCILVAIVFLSAPHDRAILPAYAASKILCPEKDIAKTIPAIKETPADLAAVTDALKGPERDNTIQVVIANLKRKYPDAKKEDILNYMLTAYCPLVEAEDGLGADEMRDRMQQFSTQVYNILSD